MIFNTRSKKPKVYNIAVLTAIFCILLLLYYWKGVTGLPVVLTAVGFLTVIIILLVDATCKQLQYNPYSYNTIYYIGFAVFVLVIDLELVLQILLHGGAANYKVIDLIRVYSSSGEQYMFVTIPFLLIFCCAMIVSNVMLLIKEGMRITNILGILLCMLIIIGEAWHIHYDYYFMGSERQYRIHMMVTSFYTSIFLYFECMLIGTIAADGIAARHMPVRNKDFMIILGCAIRKDGTPTPLLKARVDRALEFAEKQKKETGKSLIFVPSGGQGPDEVRSEAACMRDYLLNRGIPEEQILVEDQSTSTRENMLFSKEKIENCDPDARIGFSTTNYHVFRSGLLARRCGMKAVGIGAPTKWYFWPNAAVREFAGLLSEHRGKQAVILLAMIAVFMGLTVLSILQ